MVAISPGCQHSFADELYKPKGRELTDMPRSGLGDSFRVVSDFSENDAIGVNTPA
jgi:hypothetical protein